MSDRLIGQHDPLPGPLVDPAPGMVFVRLLRGMSQVDLGDFRLIPFQIEPGQAGVKGDAVEVDPETAARWEAAGLAVPEPAPEP